MTAQWIRHLALCLLFLVAPAAWGTERFAAPTDQGSGNCASEANACDLQQAINASCTAGDIVTALNGTYNVTSDNGFETNCAGANGNPIVIRAQNKHQALIKLSDTSHGTVMMNLRHKNITFSGFKMDGLRKARNVIEICDKNSPSTCDNIIVQDNSIVGAEQTCIRASPENGKNTIDLIIRRNHIASCGFAGNGEALYMGYSGGTPFVNGCEIHANRVRDFTQNGMDYKPNTESCDVHHNLFEEQVFRDESRPDKTKLEGVTVINKAKNGHFRDNIIRNMVDTSIPDERQAGIIMASIGTNVDVKNNVIFNVRNANKLFAQRTGGTVSLADTEVFGNTSCNLSTYQYDEPAGISVGSNNSNQPQSVCDARVLAIIAEAPDLIVGGGLLAFTSGLVTGAEPTKIELRFNVGGFAPVKHGSGSSFHAGWTCTRTPGGAWAISSSAIHPTANNRVVFTMGSTLASGATVACAYAPATGTLTNSANPASELLAGTYAVTNQVGTTVPALVSLAVEHATPNVVNVVVDPAGGTMVPASPNPVTGFTCRSGPTAATAVPWGGGTGAPTSARVTTSPNISLTFPSSLIDRDYFDCSYNQATGNLTNGTTELSAFTNTPGENNVLPAAPLEFVDAVVRDTDKDAVVITLNTNGFPPVLPATGGTGWTCTRSVGGAWAIESFAASGETITLDMNGDLVSGVTVTCTYAIGSAAPTRSSYPSELPGATYTVRNEVGAAPGVATLTQSDCICAELRSDDRPLFAKNTVCRVKASPDGTLPGGTFFGLCAVKATAASAMNLALKWVGDDDGNFAAGGYDVTATSADSNRVGFGGFPRRDGCSVVEDTLLQPAGSDYLPGGRVLDDGCTADPTRTLAAGSHTIVGGIFRLAPGVTPSQTVYLRLEHAVGGADLSAYTNVLTILVDEAKGMQ